MPQFDIVSFQTQIFWLFISFILFYFFILKEFLPGIITLRKLRIRRLSYLSLNNVRIYKELALTKTSLNNILRKL
jgi:hypothetical protein